MGGDEPAAGAGLGLPARRLTAVMGFGNWIEQHEFEFPADVVYETLLAVLVHSGLKIESWDASLRGVVAYPDFSWSQLFRQPAFGLGGRVAASVDSRGNLASIITIESGPAYDPQMFGEPWHRRHVQQILTALSQALGEPQK
jgi:hypothetical protein